MNISWRAVGLGLIAVAVVVCIVSWAELFTGQIMIGFLQLPPVVLALLFLLVCANRWVGRWGRRLALNAQEMAVIHVMMLLAAMISSRGLMEDLIPTLVGQNYFADSTNNWATLYFPYIKKWLVPWDPAGGEKQWLAVRFFEGLRSWEKVPWAAWVRPLAVWSTLVLAVFFAYLCLATILRKQWVENEKLSFPLAQLPLEMIRGGDGFLRNRLFWVGFTLPALLFTLNGLHNLFPTIPGVPISQNLKLFLTERPWSTVSFFVAYFSPAAVGFFFLLPTDLLFSLWFFFLLGKVQEATLVQFGLEPEAGPHAGAHLPVAAQATGAWFALVVYLILISRPHLRRVWQAARSGRDVYGEGELLSYRAAVVGLGLSFVFILGWCVAAGMSLWLAAVQFGIFLFVQAVIMARSTSEGGVLMTEGTFTPIDLISSGMARHTLGPANLTTMAFLDAMFTRDLRGLLLTGFLDGQRVADGVGMARRRLLLIFGITVIAAMLMAGALQLWLPYDKGAINLYSYAYRANNIQFFRENQPAMQGSVPVKWYYLTWVGVGCVVTALLGSLRMRFYWWPLHPLGYALSTTWTI
ncbi:MAG: hypothetical protein QHJ73_08460, partial [Armatimonadota bacterium]|nr:hypothetical protein [Armatimonadota bacterium]